MTGKIEREAEVFQQFESFDFDNNVDFHEGWQSILKRLGNVATGETFVNAKVFFFSRQVKPLDLEKYLLWKKAKHEEEMHWNGKGAASLATKAPSPDNDCSPVINQNETEPESECSPIENTASSLQTRQGLKTVAQSCGVVCESIASETLQDGISAPKAFTADGPRVSDSTEQGLLHSVGRSLVDSVNNKSEAKQANSPVVLSNNWLHPITGRNDESQPSLSLAEIAELIQNQQPIPGLMMLDVQPTNSSPTPSAVARRPKPWEMSVEESKPSITDTS